MSKVGLPHFVAQSDIALMHTCMTVKAGLLRREMLQQDDLAYPSSKCFSTFTALYGRADCARMKTVGSSRMHCKYAVHVQCSNSKLLGKCADICVRTTREKVSGLPLNYQTSLQSVLKKICEQVSNEQGS